KHIFIRTIILMVLGVIMWQRPGFAHPQWGYYSVLYRIGFAYFFASIIVLNTRISGQVLWAFGIAFFYWVLLRFVPVPGFGSGDYSSKGNLMSYIANDLVAEYIGWNFRWVLGISLIGSISNALFGAIAGHILTQKLPDSRKLYLLFGSGFLLIVLGLII